MSRTINSHTYELQEMSGSNAVYGAVISDVLFAVKFSSALTKQGGSQGHRTTRSVQKTVLVEGVPHVVQASYTLFLPNAVPATDAASAVSELKALMAETSFDAGVNSRSLG